WPYGYASFRLDLTPFLDYGKENVLAVRLDNPSGSSRWYPGSGIYRNVWLVKTDPIHIGHWGTYITTPAVTNRSATVNVKVTIENDSTMGPDVGLATYVYRLVDGKRSGRPVAEFSNPSVGLTAKTFSTIESELHIVNPSLWSPEN